jgi:hypothetical protein
VSDAFTHPAHVHFALKVTFAAMFCYIVYEAIDSSGIHTALITCTGSWWRKIWVLIVLLLVLIGLRFVEFLSLFTASSLDLTQRYSIQLTNRVQRSVGSD